MRFAKLKLYYMYSSAGTIDEKFDWFISEIINIINECRSLKSRNRRRRKRHGWISEAIIQITRKKQTLFTLSKQYPENIDILREYKLIDRFNLRDIQFHYSNYSLVFISFITCSNWCFTMFWKMSLVSFYGIAVL